MIHRVAALSPSPRSNLALIRLVKPLQAWADKTGGHWSIHEWRDVSEQLIDSADVFVIQRDLIGPASRGFAFRVQQRGKAYLYEVDDLLLDVPEHLAHHRLSPRDDRRLRWVIAQADGVTVSTPRLRAELAKLNPRCTVVPNHADPPPGGPWSATLAGRPSQPVQELLVASSDDVLVDMVMQPLQAMCRQFPQLKVVAVGPPARRLADAGLAVTGHDLMPLPAFRELLCSLKSPVGIIPLEASRFSACKSAVKYLDFASCRVPTVASAVAPYTDTIVPWKNGVLAPNTTPDWASALRRVIDDAPLRQSICDQAARDVAEYHSVQHSADAWAVAIDQATAHAAGAHDARGALETLGLQLAWQGQVVRDALRRWNRARRQHRASA